MEAIQAVELDAVDPLLANLTGDKPLDSGSVIDIGTHRLLGDLLLARGYPSK